MISIVVPVLNESENIEQLYASISSAATAWNDHWELIVIDDGSTDNSFTLLRNLHEHDSRVRAIRFSRNFGHQAAVSAGLRCVSGDCAVVMDADLQDPPDVVEQFLQKWREGFDVVYATRTKRKEGPLKRVSYWAFYRLLAGLSTVPIPLDSGDFCVMSRRVVDHLNALPERNRFIRGLRAWVGFRQVGLSYERAPRARGRAKYTFPKLLRLAFDGIINFSYRPLQLASAVGFLVAGFSLAGAVVFISSRVLQFPLFGARPEDVPGWTSLILAVLFLGGIQLVSLGILGEYVARIFDEVKQRPNHVVDDTVGLDDDPDRPHIPERKPISQQVEYSLDPGSYGMLQRRSWGCDLLAPDSIGLPDRRQTGAREPIRNADS